MRAFQPDSRQINAEHVASLLNASRQAAKLFQTVAKGLAGKRKLWPYVKFVISEVFLDITGRGEARQGGLLVGYKPDEPEGQLAILLSMLQSPQIIGRVRSCPRCGRWFAARNVRRKFCPDTYCRQLAYAETDRWEKYNLLYQRRRRARERVRLRVPGAKKELTRAENDLKQFKKTKGR